jgi:hypothetical protein
VVINCIDHAPVLLRNVSDDHNHWVELALVGGPGSPRDAIGATVYLTANGTRQRGDVMSGGSYLSSNDQRVHFGLGQATKVDDIEVHWPGNRIEHVTLAGELDRIYTIEQGKGVVPSVYDKIARERAGTAGKAQHGPGKSAAQRK